MEHRLLKPHGARLASHRWPHHRRPVSQNTSKLPPPAPSGLLFKLVKHLTKGIEGHGNSLAEKFRQSFYQ